MSGPLIRVEVLFGTVVLGRPTGTWRRDPDGWWRQVMTDTIHLDQHGRETSREPSESLIRMGEPYNSDGTPIPVAKERKGWLWRLVGKEREAPTEVRGF